MVRNDDGMVLVVAAADEAIDDDSAEMDPDGDCN